MFGSMRSLTLAAVVAVLGVAGLSVALSRGGASATAGGIGVASSSQILDAALVIPAEQPLVGGQGFANAAQARLVSPEAVAAQETSRTSFEHLGQTSAAILAKRTFPSVVNVPSGGPPKLSGGEQIARYLSPIVASLKLPGGKGAVVESLQPMAHETAPGHFTPVNLALTDKGSSYAPASSPLDIQIPKHLESGVQLADTGISLTPTDARGNTLSGSQGTIDGASVIYANTQSDTDTLVKPSTSGFEVNSVLRSIQSPTKLYFHVGMPAGAKLEQIQGANAVRVLKDGQALATIAAPSAQDAAGTSVPLSTSASGDSMSVALALGSVAHQYPIVVDPFVTDEHLTGITGGTRWKFCSTAEPKCLVRESGSYASTGWGGSGGLTAKMSSVYSTGAYAALDYQTQGESKIYEGSGEASGSDPSATVETTAQLMNAILPEHTIVEDSQVLAYSGTTSFTGQFWVCPRFANGERNCNVGAGAEKNAINFEQSATASGNTFSATLLNAIVQISQSKSPTVEFNKSEATLSNGRENVLYGSGGWYGPHSGTFQVKAKDPGIGLDYYGLGSGAHWKDIRDLVKENKCEGAQCYPSIESTYTYNSELLPSEQLEEGEHKIEVIVTNAIPGELGAAIASGTLKVDAANPYNLKLTGLPVSKEVNEQPYQLKVEASDGSGSTPSSGIKSIAVGVDGFELSGKTGTCTPGPCTASGEWTLSGEKFGAGEHTLTVVATDYAGNVGVEEYDFAVRHPNPLAVGSGEVDPTTGAFTLSATDATVAGGNGSLALSRAYNSQQLSGGSEGPLGKPWTLSVGPAQKLEKMPEGGGVQMTDASGAVTMFASDGHGGFVSPTGDKNLVLSEVIEAGKTKEFLLKDPALASTTHFTLPTGAVENPWLPHIAEGSLAANTDTYSFTQVEVEGKKLIEPEQELAPVPAGVSSCSPLVKGCRAFTFNYASSTTATGEAPSEWGDYKGHLTRVYFHAWDPTTKAMVEPVIAQYSYDKQGRLRAQWDPRISPTLKTTYGYDAEGRVVAVSPPGQQPVLYRYGALSGDVGSGRLLSATRPAASTTLGSGPAPANTAIPTLSSTSPVIGTSLSVSTNGTWSNSPLAYSYQWEDCNSSGGECVPIVGAVNQSYTPLNNDSGYALVARVTATNADGATSAASAATALVAAKTPTYINSFGSTGSEGGKFTGPVGLAADSAGNVWVTDSGDNRIEKFEASGTFSIAYGTGGAGNGQFAAPSGVAIDTSTNNVYIADTNNNRIEELNSKGEYVRAFGSVGSGKGQLKAPTGVALDAAGHVWVADTGNNRLEEFTSTGLYMNTLGSAGTGAEQFKGPAGIAFSETANMYVADSENNRVQEFGPEGKFIRQFGTSGGGNGQFAKPNGIVIDPVSGDLLVSDRENNRVQEFNQAGTYLTKFGALGSEAGQFKGPKGVIVSAGIAFVVDSANNRVERWTMPTNPTPGAPAPPSVGTSAVTTVDYRVPVSGAGAPYALGATETASWGQTDNPIEATAVFPPDSPEGWPAQSYTRASISYLDRFGYTVNTAAPGGAIGTSEYNENSEVIRSLSPANRASALKEGAKSAEVAKLLDTQSTYSEEGTELLETLGPEHKVKLSSGSEVQAREHVVYHYDEGAPGSGGPYQLLTKKTDGAKYSGSEADIRTTTTSYSGQNNLGWKLRKPTSVTTDPSGLKLISTTYYDSLTGNVIETRSPGAGPANAPVGSYGYAQQITKAGVTVLSAKAPRDSAVDSTGNLWVVDTGANRLDEYTASGEPIRQVGSFGSGNGMLNSPTGIVADSEGDVWVTDTGNHRVEEFNALGGYVRQFGTSGEGNGQFVEPWGIAIDSEKNIWVADAGICRVQKFNSTGVYLTKGGGLGTENGKFLCTMGVGTIKSMWIAGGSGGNVWVTDFYSNRIQELDKEAKYVTKFGSVGTTNGLLKEPRGISVDSGGYIWVADSKNNRVQKFEANGTYKAQFGSSGTGEGQMKEPQGLTVDSSGNVWVSDPSNNRTEKWDSTLKFSRQITVAAELPVLAKKPEGEAVDASGHLWVVENEASRLDEYSASTGEFIGQYGTTGSGNGQLKNPTGVAVDSSGNVWVADTGNNRIEKFSSTGGFLSVLGSAGEENGKFKEPWDVAIDSSKNVWVADAGNNRMQEFTSEGVFIRKVGSAGNGNGQFLSSLGAGYTCGMWLAIDASGNVWVTDCLNNRVEEFNSTGVYASKFGSAGTGDGQFKEPQGIAIDAGKRIVVVDGANHRLEQFSSTGEFLTKVGTSGPEEGQLGMSNGVASDASSNVWVGDTGNNRSVQFTFAAAGPKIGEAVYYSTAANAAYPGCGEHAEWAGLPCETLAAAQPAESAAPKLPVVTTTYNVWDEAETTTTAVGATTRTKTTTYDAAGRELTGAVSSSVGTALPTTKDEYSETTGALVKQSTTISEKTQTITSVLNTLGQQTSYTDADGEKTNFTYNVDGQAEEVSNAKGTQTYAYDPTTHALTKLLDTGAGMFTATYDVAGRMTSEGYPNGMSANYTYGGDGGATGIEYVKTTHCTEKCVWYSESVAPSIHGEMLSQTSTLSNDAFTYDAAGRLTQTQETPAGAGCKVRVYAYDTESNRTKLTSREPGAEGKCATEGGTTETHTYDEASRVIDTGISYDTFGDTTKLPAADAGGNEVTSTYYTSGQLLSQTQSGKTLTYSLDPSGRIRETVTSGSESLKVISHYAGGGSTPVWTGESSEKWSRNIPGIDGALGAVETNGGIPVLQIHDLQGDVVGTAAKSETETKLLSTYNSTEFGVPTTGSPPKYSWMGAGGTATELPSGITNSDTTSYVPQLGRPLQTEAIVPPGASPDGTFTGAPYVSGMEAWVGQADAAWAAGAAEREAARQAAAATQPTITLGEDPRVVKFYHGPTAWDKGMKLKIVSLFSFIAEQLGSLGTTTVIKALEDFIIGHYGLDRVDEWFQGQGNLLVKCAQIIAEIGGSAESHAGCRDETHWWVINWDVQIPIIGKIGFKVEIPNFWWTPRVALCSHWKTDCSRLHE